MGLRRTKSTARFAMCAYCDFAPAAIGAKVGERRKSTLPEVSEELSCSVERTRQIGV